MSEKDKSVTPRKEKHILSCDVKDINKVSTYATKKKIELEKITKKFTNIGYFGKIWDSKVPEVDKKFYYFFTLTRTNCVDVLEEVQRYKAFYEELTYALHRLNPGKESRDKESSSVSNEKDPNSDLNETGKELNKLDKLSDQVEPNGISPVERNEEESIGESHKVGNEEEPSGELHEVENEEEIIENDIIEPYEIILKMNEKLSQMTEEARLGKELTGSSAVYDLHKAFIQKHKKLENMIKRVECVALKQGLKKAIDGWKESKQSLKKVEADLKTNNEKCDQMDKKLDQVLEDNRVLKEIMREYFSKDKKKPSSTFGNSTGTESDD